MFVKGRKPPKKGEKQNPSYSDRVKSIEEVEKMLEEEGLELSTKQKVFVHSYINHNWNATRAAEIAGYSYPETLGPRMLGLPKIKEYLKRVLDERRMSAESLLESVAEHIAFDMKEFQDENGSIDLLKIRNSGKSHLINSITMGRSGITIKVPSQLEAKRILLQVHGKLQPKESTDINSELLTTVNRLQLENQALKDQLVLLQSKNQAE